MNSNPDHYVALVLTSPPPPTADNGSTPVVKQVIKLLKPNDTLLIRQVYRLFATKKSVKLGKLLKEISGDDGVTMKATVE
ncbi:hypothetical protein LINPERPRIM_LOCUS19095 [Linum perenne]